VPYRRNCAWKLIFSIGQNTNSVLQRKAFADYFSANDPYNHPVVIHNGLGGQRGVYGPLYGYPSYDGASIQTNWADVFRDTLARVRESVAAGRPWIVSNDEQGGSEEGVAPDNVDLERNKIRSQVLWGNIMAGGAGTLLVPIDIMGSHQCFFCRRGVLLWIWIPQQRSHMQRLSLTS
jgi:hypothetical protein